MVITLYGNRKQSHDHVDHISEFSYENRSESYITSLFSQFEGNYYIWQ
jgi:hypothetical protein